jgi:hypothetical protein
MIKKFLATLLAFLSITFGLGVAAPPAFAGCPGGAIGHNSQSLHEYLKVTYSFGDPTATDRNIPRGTWSSTYGCDTDGFYVPAYYDVLCYVGAWYRFKPTGWTKINDGFEATCKVVRQV